MAEQSVINYINDVVSYDGKEMQVVGTLDALHFKVADVEMILERKIKGLVPERCVVRYGDLMNSLLSLEATPEDFFGYDKPFLTEVGLYMLPVRIRSKECAALQLWVTDQLLPSFRKKKQPPSAHWHRRR